MIGDAVFFKISFIKSKNIKPAKTIETKETSATSAPESITVETPEKDTEVADECVPAEGDADVPDIEVPEKGTSEQNDSPLSSAINALFDDIPQVDKMAEKVNSSLDEMGEQLKKFSTERAYLQLSWY